MKLILDILGFILSLIIGGIFFIGFLIGTLWGIAGRKFESWYRKIYDNYEK